MSISTAQLTLKVLKSVYVCPVPTNNIGIPVAKTIFTIEPIRSPTVSHFEMMKKSKCRFAPNALLKF